LHRVRVNAGWAGGIAYRTPTQSVIPQPGENGFHVDGGYEYRRYLFRDLWADGLDVGMGVEGLASVRRATFAFDPSIEARHRGTDLTASIIAAARLRRWQAWQLEVAWVNGISLGRSSVRHSAAAVPETREWGGGWLTDLVARVDLRMSPTLGLFVTALTSARGLYESHASAMTGRTQFLAGITYAR
jgi:hypothetical protein